MKTVAFVPIRLNSQRVAGKNLRPLDGSPLMCHILKTLTEVEGIDEVYVFCSDEGIRALLPLSLTASSRPQPEAAALYEPDPQTVFDAIIPEYLGGVVYGALCESVASELAARRTAMDAATKNADEMIGNLNLQFNRARQGAITQEITEIVAGAEA